MTDSNYALMLRNLSKDYYLYRIGLNEYRSQRKILLDKIDAEFNGDQPKSEEPEKNPKGLS